MKYFIVSVLLTIALHTQAQPAKINFKTSQPIYPEGIAYYPAKDAFLVSSVTKGQIGVVDRKGNYTLFLDHPDLISSFGLKVVDNKLYVSCGDLGLSVKSTKDTPKKIGRLLVFDLNSRKLIKKYDLDKLYRGEHWSNDMAISPNGDVYVTDSFSPVIYRVTADGEAGVFVEHELFKGAGINLNGIVLHPDGYLLVAKSSDGKLFKVDISSKKVTEVNLTYPLTGTNGLLLNPQNELLASQDTKNQVHKLHTPNNWETGVITSSETNGLDFPTTLTNDQNGRVFFLNSYISDLFKGENKRTEYFIKEFSAYLPAADHVQHLVIDDLQPFVLSDKVTRTLISGQQGMMARFTMKKGAVVSKHSHVNEQLSMIVKGKVKATVGEKEYIVSGGECLVIPANVSHAFEALEDTIDIDFFSPIRDQDWVLGKSNPLKGK